MVWWSWSCCVLLLLFSQAHSVIWSKNSNQQITPMEIDVQASAMSGNMGPGHDVESSRLYRRQSTADGIGYTAHLTGDNHRHGLVHWTGFPSEYLFVLTRNVVTGTSRESWLWRSTDYGHTFNNDTVKWNADTVIQWYYIAPLNEYLIFADITHQILWVTSDEGDTYTNHPVQFSPDRLIFQSQQAVNSTSPVLAQYVLGYDNSDRSLWVSSNLGATWTKLGADVISYSWRVLDSSLEDSTTVYYEKILNATHSQLWTSSYPYQTSTLFDEHLTFLQYSFVLSNEYMFVQMSADATSTQYSSPLWVSRNRQAFRQARFPLLSQERQYAVVDTSEGQVFIAVYHDINNTNLYLSEVEGLNYSLSLTHLVSPPENEWIQDYPEFDLHVVEGIVGTFIANIQQGRLGSTVISYDKGGNWVQLRPPTVDRNDAFLDCQLPNCSLHLHIKASRATGYESILTQDSAIGLIMAVGNLGSSLTNDNSRLRQYFSRDGGFTWLEVDTGFRQFEFAAQGAIVASVSVFRYTSTVKWSCDEGVTWTEENFLTGSNITTGVSVIGMLTEPGERALHVTVFGIVFPFVEWLVIDLNFTSVLPNQCTPDDFFTWIPTDDRPGSRCVLGESVMYERRRSEDCCYVDPQYNRLIGRSTCNCTLEDFECDFGFERIHLNSPCTPLPDFLWPPLQPTTCPEGTTYSISSGYRLVAGDKCTQGDELSYYPIERPCIVGPPQIIALQKDILFVMPNIQITFSLIQIQGGKLSTQYLWNFNDSTAAVNVTGYERGHMQMHTFTAPGIYNVTIIASSNEGSSSLTLPISVLDPVSNLAILAPSQLTTARELPVGTQLVFAANWTTVYGTNFTGNLYYNWVFRSVSHTSRAVTHVFDTPGTETIFLSIIYAGANTRTTQLSVTILDLLASVELSLSSVPVAGIAVTLTSDVTATKHTTDVGTVTYEWNFGDGSSISSVSTTNRSIQYTFDHPGNYTLSLSAANQFSTASMRTKVVVLDQLERVEIVLPKQAQNGQLPASLQLVFSARIYTVYNTTIHGDLVYVWDFDDGSQGSGVSTSHAYAAGGDYTVMCTVRTPFGDVSGQVQFTVFEASTSVEISSLDILKDTYVMTQQQMELSVNSIDSSDHIIPPDTYFMWTVLPDHLSDSACPSPGTGNGESTFVLTFLCWGDYDVSVIGNHSAGSFVTQLYLKAEDAIGDVEVGGVPAVARSDARLSISLHSSKRDSTVYEGPLFLTILSSNGSKLTTSYSLTNGQDELQVLASRDQPSNSEKTLTVLASNHVSNISVDTIVVLAAQGQYGQLRFLFDVGVSANLGDLEVAIVSTVRSNYLTELQESFVELEGSGVIRMNSTDIPPTPAKLAVRATGEEEEFLYIDVNILPKSLSPEDIAAVIEVAEMIASEGQLTLTFQNTSVQVPVITRSSETRVIKEPPNTTLYVGLGLGLGLGLIVILAIAVVLGVVLYIYRRNYKRLNVRYARLRQTPVRFSFTQAGEMVEEDDYEGAPFDDDDEEETNIQT